MSFVCLKKRFLEEESGFTLAEMLVAMTLMVTVLFALYGIFDMSIRVFSYGNDKIEAVENARVGLEKMQREIRAAYPTGSGSGLVSSPSYPTSNQINFSNNAGSTVENITYALSGSSASTLQRNGDVVVRYVDVSKGPIFTFLKSDGSNASSEAEVARVRITLNISVPGVQAGTQTLTTEVDLRNR